MPRVDRSALERLRASREDGVSAAALFEEEEEDLSDYEDTAPIDDNFVVGNDLGYAETGDNLEELDRKEREKFKAKQKLREKKKKEKVKRKRLKEQQKKKKKGLFDFSVKKPTAQTASKQVVRTKKDTASFMDNLLDDSDDEDVEMIDAHQTTQEVEETAIEEENLEIEEETKPVVNAPTTQPKKPVFKKRKVQTPLLKTVSTMKTNTPTSSAKKPLFGSSKKTPTFKKTATPTFSSKRTTSTPKKVFTPTAKDISEPPAKRRKPNTPQVRVSSNLQTFDEPEDGYINFYLLDMYEDVYNSPGKVFLFGRRAIPGTSNTESCCVIMRNVNRCLYVLPKETIDGNDRIPYPEVVQEVFEYFASKNIKMICKKERRHSCFESRSEVPETAEYVKIQYPFSQPLILNRVEEERRTFRRVFGVNSSAKELLILDCNIQGPGWYKMKVDVNEGAKSSWCQTEYFVDKKHKQNMEPVNGGIYSKCPGLKVMSVAIQTRKNPKNKTDELVCISTKTKYVWVDGNHEEETVTTKNFLCRIPNQPWPQHFEVSVPATCKHCTNETVMLNAFCLHLLREDPDILVGHSFFNFGIEVLLTRMKKLRIGQWSKCGRLRRSYMPKHRFLQKGVCSGRLLCDTFTSAQEFLYGEKNYNLSALVKTQFNEEHSNIDVASIPERWSKGESIIEVIAHCERDAMLSLRLMVHLQILELTKQLTCLCGNNWQESLSSQRAKRNEFLLLHKFHDEKYLVPEKYTKQEKIDLGIVKAQPKSKKGRRKKAEYSGGLVLEPKAGFYNSYILLLDFNSLYPSIIQEYNLCFSTCQHWDGMFNERTIQSVFDNYPYGDENDEALLPRLITHILKSRVEVKKKMKAAQNEALKKSLNIKQLAYKLVANSMYGCLGFYYSRFYCKPIAALITALGRKNLQKAADTAVTHFPNLDVVYGDTDSIMVNTGIKSKFDDNGASLNQATTFAHKIKKKLNDTYRKMYLELDEVFYKFLLLKKKKYSALKNINGNIKYEHKGLDLVRRDWAKISSQIGKQVLDIIMTTEDIDETAEKIKTYLVEKHNEIITNKLPLELFQITKKLTRDVGEYKEGTKMAHVEAAKRMRADGIPANTGDFIQYIVTDGDGAESSRTYHIDQVRAKKLTIDVEYYLKTQIIPPICRLIQPMEVITAPMIGECFGVDVRSAGNRIAQTGGVSHIPIIDIFNDDNIQFESEKDLFKNCDPVKLGCRYCDAIINFKGVLHPETNKVGFKCYNANCNGFIKEVNDINYYKNQLQRQFNSQVRKYYQRKYVCHGSIEPSKCMYTRASKIVTFGFQTNSRCGGFIRETFSAKQLNTQLDYMIYLFDVAKAEAEYNQRLRDAKVENAPSIKEMYSAENVDLEVLNQLQQFVDNLKAPSSYHTVDVNSMFKQFIPLR